MRESGDAAPNCRLGPKEPLLRATYWRCIRRRRSPRTAGGRARKSGIFLRFRWLLEDTDTADFGAHGATNRSGAPKFASAGPGMRAWWALALDRVENGVPWPSGADFTAGRPFPRPRAQPNRRAKWDHGENHGFRRIMPPRGRKFRASRGAHMIWNACVALDHGRRNFRARMVAGKARRLGSWSHFSKRVAGFECCVHHDRSGASLCALNFSCLNAPLTISRGPPMFIGREPVFCWSHCRPCKGLTPNLRPSC